MPDVPTSRPFKQRLLDTFDRSRLREEVRRARGSRLSSIKKRYATMVLGASLAVGGIGIPLKNVGLRPDGERQSISPATATSGASAGVMDEISADLMTATAIAREVTGGVETATRAITSPIAAPVEAIAKQAAGVEATEKLREEFFNKNVPFGQLIYREAVKNDLDPELVAAVVQTESRFKPTARSPVGAQGLMQLVPRTGKWMGARNLMNPAENVKAGTKYLKYLNERFDGDQKKVLAAYNAGEGNVRRYGGVPPFRETRNYVRKVTSAQKDFEDKVTGHVATTVEEAGEIVTDAAADATGAVAVTR